jgi:hypothetical protein
MRGSAKYNKQQRRVAMKNWENKPIDIRTMVEDCVGQWGGNASSPGAGGIWRGGGRAATGRARS